MDRRRILHLELKETPGIKKVYFQPPEDVIMEYSCIRYNREGARLAKADNLAYRFTQRYTLYVITQDPDCQVPKYLVEHFQMCSIDRSYTADNLYHTVLTLFY